MASKTQSPVAPGRKNGRSKGGTKSLNRAMRRSGGLVVGSSFDGANYSKNRDQSHLWVADLGTREEVNPLVRTELNRRAGVLCNSLAPMRALIRKVIYDAVGHGIFPIPLTNDEDFNLAMGTFVDNHFSNKSVFDARGQRTGWKMQELIVNNLFRQGEAFIGKVRSKTIQFPQFQAFDATEIGNVGADDEGDRIFDGVITDKIGKVTGYRIPTGDNDEGRVDFGVTDMLHVVDLERVNQYRSPSWFYSGLNSGQDLMELMASQKVGAKLQNMVAIAIKRAAGAAAGSKKFGSTLAVHKANGSTDENGARVLEAFGGFGCIAYLQPGEEIQLLQGGGADEKFNNLVKLLLCELAWAIGVPAELLFFIAGLGNGAIRGGIESYGKFLEFVQDLINDQFNQPAYVWLAAWAQKHKKVPRCKDPVWWKCAWQGPPKVTLDLPKMGKLSIDLHNHGFLTEADYWSMVGKDWRAQQDQKIREIRRAKLKCLEASDDKVTVDYYRDYRVAPAGSTLQLHAPEEPQETEKAA
jgi:capsid protein